MKMYLEESRVQRTHRIPKLVACENLWRILARYLLDCHVCAPKCHFLAILDITFTCWCAVSTLRYLCSASRSLTLHKEATFPSQIFSRPGFICSTKHA